MIFLLSSQSGRGDLCLAGRGSLGVEGGGGGAFEDEAVVDGSMFISC